MNLTKRPKSVIILGLLLERYPIKFGDREYCMVDERFGVMGQRLKVGIDSKVEEVFLVVEVTVDSFIHICNQLSDEDVALLVANKALTDIKRKDR